MSYPSTPFRPHPPSCRRPWYSLRFLPVLLGLGLIGPAPSGAQRLTEFLAVNATGLEDEDGSRQPWVEIWNQNQVSVLTMSGYKLTDGVSTWPIPVIRVMPDERIIIWVSGKNRSVVTAPLHAGFTLSAAAGSSISLLNSANNVVSTFGNYPVQTADVSYGRDETDTATDPVLRGYYSEPTPLEKNNHAGPGVAGEVVFSQKSRAFHTSDSDAVLSVDLTQAVPNQAAEIRYTSNFTNQNVARQQHTASLLPNGKVLLAGGQSTSVQATAELFEPTTTSWMGIPNLSARRRHTATLLPDGKVLVAGGTTSNPLATSQVYDPAANTWSAAGELAAARHSHTASLLGNGKVLVAGGLGAGALNSAELFDPATGTWSAAGNMAGPRHLHTATVLADGKVLVTGGQGDAVLNSAEIYDPAANTWSAAGNMEFPRSDHTATLLANGKVLVTGGQTATVNTSQATVEIFDPASKAWTPAAPLAAARRMHTATLLPDNRVLVAGGANAIRTSLSSAQIYDPASDAWISTPGIPGTRHLHTATLLPDGTVLLAGGVSTTTSLSTAAIYNPGTDTWEGSPRVAGLPGSSSRLYTAPLSITTTTMIRARVFQEGLLPGKTATEGYLKLDNATARNFSSPMPVMVISSFGVVPPNDGDLTSFMWVWHPAAPDNRSRFSNPPELATRTVIDKRGSSTLGNPKYSLNVETRRNYDDEERNVSLLDMPSHSDWVLHAPYSFDRALIRNPLMYALSNEIGRYAVRNVMAEVFMDSTGAGLNYAAGGSGDYFGIFNVMEKIRRNSERVDIERLETYDNDPVSRTGGYIFKVDRLDAGDSGFPAGGQTLAYYYPKERDLVSPQRDPQEQFLRGYINEFNSRLSSANYQDPELGYASRLDVDAAIDHHLLNVWSFNVDALRLSGYWHKDREGKLVPGPIWDFDRTLSSTDDRDDNPNVWRSANGDRGTDFFNYTWWVRLFRDPDFYQKYIDRWQELRAGGLARDNVEAIIDQLASELSPDAVSRDLSRWNQTKRSWTRPFPAPENGTVSGQAGEILRIKDYLQQRANFMDSQWVGPVTASVSSGFVAPGTTVTLTGPAGVPIYYTLDGSDPRPSGGAAPGVGPVLYTPGEVITVNATTRLRARAYKANHTALTGASNPPLKSNWGGPVDAFYLTDAPANPGSLILSELHYHPADPTPSELAINPGWVDDDFEFVELRNVSSSPVNLSGANFSRGITLIFTGESARILAPGESLVVASNPAAFAARYGNSLTVAGPWIGNLSNSGENLTLLSHSGEILFSIDYLDDWVPEADSGGASMVAHSYFPDDINSPSAWRPSSVLGGSPGGWDAAGLVVSAGPDVSVTFPAPAQVNGTKLTGGDEAVLTWTKLSGPGVLTLATPSAASTSVTADLPGAYRLRLSLTIGAETIHDEVNLFLVDTPGAWLARHPGIGSLTDDFDKDGRIHLMEFALGTSPLEPDGSGLPAVSTSGGHLTFTYPRRKPASTVIYTVEISGDAGTWRLPESGELAETILADDGVVETVQITDSAPLGTPDRRFLRLRVTVP